MLQSITDGELHNQPYAYKKFLVFDNVLSKWRSFFTPFAIINIIHLLESCCFKSAAAAHF